MPTYELVYFVEADDIIDAATDAPGAFLVSVRKLSASNTVQAQTEHPKVTPAQIKASVTRDYLICLEDGKKFKSLKRHLRTHYNLSPKEYREKWGLPDDYPMTAPGYSETRSALAKANGLGRKET